MLQSIMFPTGEGVVLYLIPQHTYVSGHFLVQNKAWDKVGFGLAESAKATREAAGASPFPFPRTVQLFFACTCLSSFPFHPPQPRLIVYLRSSHSCAKNKTIFGVKVQKKLKTSQKPVPSRFRVRRKAFPSKTKRKKIRLAQRTYSLQHP